MKSAAKKTVAALKTVFADRRGIRAFVISTLAIVALFVMIPVWTTPGNDVLFQLSIMKAETYAIMFVLAPLNGLVIAMQWHIQRHGKTKAPDAAAGGLLGGLAASFFATIGCAACYSSVLALFGLGGTIFIVEHRYWFAAAGVAISLFALAKSASRIEDGCVVACKL